MTSEKCRNYVLAIILERVWEHSLIDQLIKHTLCVRKFTDLIRGRFVIGPVIKADTMC